MSTPFDPLDNPFDQLGKKIGARALGPCGPTEVQQEIFSNAHHADLRHAPDPARDAERARLGLLGRLAALLCLLELFSGAPGEDEILDCLGKLIAFRQELRRAAVEKEAAEPAPTPGEKPAARARFARPFLWVLCARRPSGVLAMLAAVPAEGWPDGVYVSPGKPERRGASPAPAEPGGLLRVGIVVASELPRVRETILVRIMAGGAGLRAALDELRALPVDAPEWKIASTDVLELRRALEGKANRTAEEEEIVVSTQNIVEEIREEGRVEARARDVLTVLRARGIPVPDAARERILAEKEPTWLERWLEKAAVAASVAEVIGEPS
jgi:hypothetical protein